MATTLETKLRQILNEKEQKILPENIKRGTKIFDIEGELEEGYMGEYTYDNCLRLTSEILGTDAIKTDYLFANGTFHTISDMSAILLLGVEHTTFEKSPNITLYIKGTSGSGSEYILVSDTKINFTDIDKLEITMTSDNVLGNASYYNYVAICLPETYSETSTEITNQIHYMNDDFNGTLSLDVSNITGERYLLFRISCRAYSSSIALTISAITTKKLLDGGES